MLALAFALLASGPIETWRARSDDAYRAQDWCTSFFYRSRILERTNDDIDAYRAFQAAYQADLMKTALNLYPRIKKVAELGLTADGLASLEQTYLDLLSLKAAGTLADVECHKPPASCGDFMAMYEEKCDDGNAVSGDGCSSTCTLEDAEAAALEPLASSETRRDVMEPAVTDRAAQPVTSDAPPAGGLSPMLLGGAIVGAAGLAVGATGSALSLINDATIADASSSGSAKNDALLWRAVGWVFLGSGVLFTLGGGALAAWGLQGGDA